jgi:CrtC N-terminal lipocalin domain
VSETEEISMSNTPLAVAASTPTDYQRLGISPDRIAAWEDGARTDNGRGSYEWWYFDAHLDDGSKLVIVFMNKDLSAPGKPLAPLIRLNLDLADGRSFEKIVNFAPESWSAAKDHADVRIGDNRFTGDLDTYRITTTVEEIEVDITLTGTVPSWRPETGYMLFGRDRDLEFAWLPSVPQGRVEAEYSIAGEAHASSGVGYHDHNWGNVGLMKVIHDWYWARGQAGPYSVIASYITAHEKYDYAAIPILMIARDGRIIADDASKVRFETENVFTDPHTGKPVAGITRYTYEDGDDRYEVTFTRHEDLVRARMIDATKGIKRLAARAVGFDGAYLRFTGECSVRRFERGVLVEQHEDPAIWELMYFGHAR